MQKGSLAQKPRKLGGGGQRKACGMESTSEIDSLQSIAESDEIKSKMFSVEVLYDSVVVTFL